MLRNQGSQKKKRGAAAPSTTPPPELQGTSDTDSQEKAAGSSVLFSAPLSSAARSRPRAAPTRPAPGAGSECERSAVRRCLSTSPEDADGCEQALMGALPWHLPARQAPRLKQDPSHQPSSSSAAPQPDQAGVAASTSPLPLSGLCLRVQPLDVLGAPPHMAATLREPHLDCLVKRLAPSQETLQGLGLLLPPLSAKPVPPLFLPSAAASQQQAATAQEALAATSPRKGRPPKRAFLQ